MTLLWKDHAIYWFHEEYNKEGLLIWIADMAGTIIPIAKAKASLTRTQLSRALKYISMYTPPPQPILSKHTILYKKKRLNDLTIVLSVISSDMHKMAVWFPVWLRQWARRSSGGKSIFMGCPEATTNSAQLPTHYNL